MRLRCLNNVAKPTDVGCPATLRITLSPNNTRYGGEVQHAIARGNSVGDVSGVTDITLLVIQAPQVKAFDQVAVSGQVLSNNTTNQSF